MSLSTSPTCLDNDGAGRHLEVVPPSDRLAHVLELATALPSNERAELAEQLLDGLTAEDESSPSLAEEGRDVPESHRVELDRRLALADGPGRPWREAMDELRARRHSGA